MRRATLSGQTLTVEARDACAQSTRQPTRNRPAYRARLDSGRMIATFTPSSSHEYRIIPLCTVVSIREDPNPLVSGWLTRGPAGFLPRHLETILMN
jgi:hypothetical protein